MVTNIRHYDSLLQTQNSLQNVINGIDGAVTNDFVAMDIRRALHYLGEITTDDLLANLSADRQVSSASFVSGSKRVSKSPLLATKKVFVL